MKKIIMFFLVAFLCNFSYAQFPITQNLGAPKTLVVNKGGFQSDTTLILPTFNDTTIANQSTLVKIYPGNLIRVKDTLYFRNKTATAWVKLATGNVAPDSSLFATHYYVDSSINSIGVPDLQSVTDAGNTTTNTITLDGGDLNVDGGNVVLRGDLGSNISWTDNVNSTSLQCLLPLKNATISLPDTSGTLALSVNGNFADSSGNITIPSGGGGGGSSVNYYLNGSVNQGTFGGDTYYQLSKNPIAGAGTNFTRTNASGNGYIASFITDAGDPNLLNMPGGNWNLEVYFNSSSSGGSPTFYGEIYKVSAANVFTLIASGSTNPEGITNGTTVDQYFTSIPVPQTTLVATDRIAIRIFVTPGGRNITLHTEDNNLSEVLTTFSTGLNALNGLTAQVQYFAVDTSGTDFNISSDTNTHTFNLPTASATNRGALSSADWSTFNGKQDSSTSWKTTGNFNVNAGEFIGSRNNASLRFRTNGVEKLYLDSTATPYMNLGNFNAGGSYLKFDPLNRYISFFTQGSNDDRIAPTTAPSGGGGLAYFNSGSTLGNLIGQKIVTNTIQSYDQYGGLNITGNKYTSGANIVFKNTFDANQDRMIIYSNSSAEANISMLPTGGSVGIGTTSPATSSVVDMTSTKGLLIPRVSTSQRNAITSPASQLLVSNTDKKTLDQYNGTSWNSIAGDFNKDILGLQALGSPVKSSPIGTQFMPSTSAAMSGSRSFFSAIVVDKEITITGAMWYQGVQGVYIGTGGNYNGIALYSQNNGTLTLIDSTARDTTIWKAPSASWNQKAFAGGSRTLQPGVYYLFALSNTINGNYTTAPVIGIWQSINLFTNMATNSAKLYGGSATGVTIPPTTQAMSAWNNFSFYFSLYLY